MIDMYIIGVYRQRNHLEWGFKGETDDNEFLGAHAGEI